MRTQINRRHLLRGTGALVALPALESIGFRRFASAASTVPAAQVVAQQLGRDTRFSSIQLNAASLEGHGPGLSLAWDQRGKPGVVKGLQA